MAAATGAGLADALDRIGEAMRHEHEVANEVSGQLSSTRATAVILATLPLVAVAMGSLLGADPLHVLTGTPVGGGCLVLGLSLIGLGWWWISRQVAAVRIVLRW
jgi:tight adherence protein B